MSKTNSPQNPSKGYLDHPGYKVRLKPVNGLLRVMFGGETVVETDRAMVLLETRHAPVYYFEASDVKEGILLPSNHSTYCPFKGDAVYWSLKVGEHVSENAVWGYPEPLHEVPELASLVSFFQDRVDSWWLDDVEIETPVMPAD
jgi:uncharacterized protein (DUF427 family)